MRDYAVAIIEPGEEPYAAIWELPELNQPGFHKAMKTKVEAVTGKPCEHVNVFADFHGGQDFRYLDMFVNEHGHLMSPPLPYNALATAIYQNNVRVHFPEADIADPTPIVGAAVLFEEKVWR